MGDSRPARHTSLSDIRWARLTTGVQAMFDATETVLGHIPHDTGRQARLLALSDVLALIHHAEAEEAKHG